LQALASDVPFTGSDVARTIHLLDDDDAKYRLAVIGVLKRGLLLKSEIKEIATRLLGDPEHLIREHARLLIDSPHVES